MRPYQKRSSEFIAWYPNALNRSDDRDVWTRDEAAFYVHIPFCDQICDYCGFAVTRRKNAEVEKYVDCLIKEIGRPNTFFATKKFTVGHFGGGTPSVLEPDMLGLILEAVDSAVDLSNLKELTIEVNPISLTKEKARGYLGFGANRLSIGVQTFNRSHLLSIGRPHRPNEAIRTFEDARDAGFQNISLDLMYALPGQTLSDLDEDIDQLIDMAPDHISCFPLEVIPMTPLDFRKKLAPEKLPAIDEEVGLQMHFHLLARMRAAGYRHYGAMNFAVPGKESEHNRIAFVAPQGEYIGWGNGAYSFMNDYVFCNDSDVNRYMRAIEKEDSPVAFSKRATQLELASRMVALGLKFLSVDRNCFERRFGFPLETFFGQTIDMLREAGLIGMDEDSIFLTDIGVIYVNNVCKEFFVGENRHRPQWVQYEPTISAEMINRIFDQAKRDQGQPN